MVTLTRGSIRCSSVIEVLSAEARRPSHLDDCQQPYEGQAQWASASASAENLKVRE